MSCSPRTLVPCLASAPVQVGDERWASTFLDRRLPGLDDEEGPRLPEALPHVVDAHVHLFPDRVFDALWRWFEEHAWPVRYPLRAPEVVDFLLSRGVRHLVALHYAHTPGMARSLNRFVAELCASRPRVTGLATVFPGEPGAVQILEEGFSMGLSGVKLHCHVQGMGLDHPAMEDVYRTCAAHERPLVIHAGREPSSPAYPVDAHAICSADRLEEVLRTYPSLRICVPHLGADEFEAYGQLLERYDNLWLDTTMVLADYFPVPDPGWLLEVRPERVMYGTDFPNLPFAWDREVRRLVERGLPEDSLARVLGGTAAAFYGLDLVL